MTEETMRVLPSGRLSGTVRPPGAKSGTVRGLLSGALAGGRSTLRNAGSGDNVHAMAAACRALGADVRVGADRVWTVDGTGGVLPDTAELDAGNSGIVLRLLAAVGAALPHCTVGTANAQSLGRRGNAELVDALRQLGADCTGAGAEARPPLVVRRAGLHGGTATVSGRRSSQFLSGLLFLAPLVGEDVELVVPDRLTSAGMVGSTVSTLARAGVTVQADPGGLRFRVAAGQAYRPADFDVPTDASSLAGVLAAAAAVPGSAVTVAGVPGDDHAAAATLDALAAMGVRVERGDGELTCFGTDEPVAVDLDASGFLDSVLPLAALACYARGTTVFGNVETLRFKECDRISDFRRELGAAGADVDERRDALVVHGRPRIRGGGTVHGRHDHSVVMALAALALRSQEGLRIAGWRAVGQTYRTFFEDLAALGAQVGTERRSAP